LNKINLIKWKFYKLIKLKEGREKHEVKKIQKHGNYE